MLRSASMGPRRRRRREEAAPGPRSASATSACRRVARRTLSWHESRSRAWQVALTEPDIAHKKQNYNDNTDDSEDAHTTLLVLLGTRKLCAHPGSSRSLGYGLPCGALVPHLIETPCNACISTSVAQASRAICDILATNVGIVRKSGPQKQTADNVKWVAVSSISAMPRLAGGKPRSTTLSSSRLTSGGDLLALVLEV
jgi:hypothetical protein